MWLSVVIPCYNSANTIRWTLDSIIRQNVNDYEVIICDDHSTDNTIEICHEYDELLPLKYISTAPHGRHCPNNTRYDGYQAAHGEWITFIDHDDVFVDGVFQKVRNVIEESLAENPNTEFTLIGGRTILVNEDQIIQTFNESCSNLLHGKFYYRPFLDNNGLGMLENVVIYEDILFNNRFVSYCCAKHKTCIFLDEIFYKWNLNGRSFSHWLEPYGVDFDIFYFDYWIESISWPYFEAYEKYGDDENREELLVYSAHALLSFYFLYMINLQVELVSPKYMQLKIKELIKNIIRIFYTDINEIVMYALSDGEVYNGLRDGMIRGRGIPFIESKTFYQFINDVVNDNFDSGFVVKVVLPQEVSNE